MRKTFAILAAIGVGVLVPAAASAPSAHFIRWRITGNVLTGTQVLSRITDATHAGYTGGGSISSSWTARWTVRVRVDGRQLYIFPANALVVTGKASGEYHGSYPVINGTKSYSCPFGPIAPRQTMTKFRLYGTGRSDAKVTMIFGSNGEPAALPGLTCTGDAVDNGVPRTISEGIFTGVESGCFRTPAALTGLGRKQFGLLKEFKWAPTSPSGASRPCSGFGAPIHSAGHGTLRLTFRRLP